jgi:hypothetical protein
MVHIHLDPVVKSVERRCFTLIDVLQRVGGMMGLIQTVGLMIASYFQRALLTNEIIKQT